LKEHVEHQRKLSIDRASDFALALCETVKIAHTEGILHRDIKPDNIIIRDAERNELYIVDYGLSFNATDEDLTETVETFRNKFLDLPETNTPGGNRRDPRSDVTALCAVFYYMLSGHHPGHLQDASGKMPHLRPGFTVRDAVASDARTTQVELILSRGLAPQLQSRFQTIDEFAARLASLRQQSSSCPTSDPIATAAELSARLREQDRKTQLVEFQPAANKMLTEFASKLNAIGKKLGRFKLKAGGGGRDGPKLGDGLDPVSGPFTATVSVANHEAKRFRTYKVASRGEQCVVCACDFRSEADKTKPAPTDWREIAWYEGTSTDVIPVLEREFMQWLDGAIQQIAQQVFAG
jgi:serine/threonine protein kinase